MQFEYETEHLFLKLLHPSTRSIDQVLYFYQKNHALFEQYEAARSADFYTRVYQKKILTHEYNLAVQNQCFRFWVYEKSNLDHIIGTISFYNIMRSIYDRCETGYKFDPDFWHRGYARESMSLGISLMFEELDLHRIEAYVMKENKPSIRLLSALNFQLEGICRKSIRIRDKWEDHMLFALIK